MENKIENGSGIGELAPSAPGANVQRLVIGYMPVACAEGKEFIKAHVGFQDGSVLVPVLDAVVYQGDELFIGKRKIPREKGREFWIVTFRTTENPVCMQSQDITPNSGL